MQKTKAEKLTASDIMRWFWNDRGRRYALLMPRYTPAYYGFECDLFGVTKAGLGHEFEIKLSVSDFRADALKKRSSDGLYRPAVLGGTGSSRPSRFYYVSPVGVLSLDLIPAWAGWIEVSGRPSNLRASCVLVRKDAPRLHGERVPDATVQHMRGVCYWRYWAAVQQLQRVRAGRER